MGFWAESMRAIKEADAVLLVLDSRMPELSRNKDLEEKLKKSNKNFFLVFNKIDLISKETLEKIKKSNKEAFFVSTTTKEGIPKLRTSLLILAKKLNVKLEIGMVGYPNVGKSALTNILSRGNKTKVSSKAGTTTGIQWASSNQFKIVDSPGVIPYEDDEIKLGILGAKNPEKIKNLESVSLKIIQIFLENNKTKLEEHFNFKISSEDEYEILLEIGHAKNLLKKGGTVDEQRTSLMIIRDWQKGKL
ncbi:MAG: 50S ribosome-binding GTPase, partial [Nanoarchaeota archaeon]|nr:50S ribosome-binding GTPase [Nanoarchaeota archaeon]